jgi:hypothetical protein
MAKAVRPDWLPRGMLPPYFCASFLHFTHNAEFVNEYANLPWWITRSSVYSVWLAATAVGMVVALSGFNRKVSGPRASV